MKRTSRHSLLMIVIAVFTALNSQAAFAAGKLHLIVVGDTKDPTIGQHARVDMTSLSSSFYLNIRSTDLRMRTLADNSATRRQLLNEIRSCGAGPQDAIMVYYSGHGRYTNGGGHELVTLGGSETIDRSEILAEMKRANPRLVVLLTDACFDFYNKRTPPAVAAPALPNIESTQPIFRKLFFEARGIIDVNSARKGQVAATYPNPFEGSVFTRSFGTYLKDNLTSAEITWDDVLRSVEDTTKREFRVLFPDGKTYRNENGDFLEQSDQRLGRLQVDIKGYDAGGGSGGNSGGGRADSVRLGIHFEVNGNSAKVITVVANGPATRGYDNNGQRYFLEPGDRILSVNGDQFSSFDEFTALIRGSSQNAQMRIQGTNNRIYDLRFTLNPYNGGYPINGGQAVQPDPNMGTRFGAWVEDTPQRHGVRVTGVQAGSPALRCRMRNGQNWTMEAGEIIVRVNGRVVRSEAEYREAIRVSPQHMEFDVVGRDNKTYPLTVRLNY